MTRARVARSWLSTRTVRIAQAGKLLLSGTSATVAANTASTVAAGVGAASRGIVGGERVACSGRNRK
eukprot:CAMPEP_0170467562 /NCGR_PEP_ID=MMETSP0123-20130129/11101_1 /TAXON_ID=182087 /ORGANISM="Favella ehrenbergii, Strain Fehren 1" /LENGTH=66 /DNA_ID=CAMNT_0010733973 /DNA_START=310 /DNA_END=510 /DNA_ORIENTATION=+